jgi:hypothetical protein
VGEQARHERRDRCDDGGDQGLAREGGGQQVAEGERGEGEELVRLGRDHVIQAGRNPARIVQVAHDGDGSLVHREIAHRRVARRQDGDSEEQARGDGGPRGHPFA